MVFKRRVFTAAEFKERINYNPDTGVFTKAARPGKKLRGVGEKIGFLANGYWYLSFKYNKYPGHHVAWLMHYGEWPDQNIDHIDGNPLNNAISNLRKAPQIDNCKNHKISRANKTGVTGVTWDSQTSQWRAVIAVNYKYLHIGRYDSFEQAVAARKSAEQKYFGEFARAS